MREARIIDLQIQPLKGGAALPLTEARMTMAGLETVGGQIKDHGLVVVSAVPDKDGYHPFLTQRVQVVPAKNLYVEGSRHLALIKPGNINGGLVFNFNGQDEIEDPGESSDKEQNAIPVQVWEYRGHAIEVPHLSSWISGHLDRDLKVARTSGPWNRMARQNFLPNSNPLRAQDGYPIHAISQADAKAIFEALGAEVDPSRFRYQMLLEGLNFREIHDYEHLLINGVEVDVPKPCERCEVTGIDQMTGELSPIKPLSGFNKIEGVGRWIRQDNGQKAHIMGENWLPQGETIVREGETVLFDRARQAPLVFEQKIPSN